MRERAHEKPVQSRRLLHNLADPLRNSTSGRLPKPIQAKDSMNDLRSGDRHRPRCGDWRSSGYWAIATIGALSV